MSRRGVNINITVYAWDSLESFNKINPDASSSSRLAIWINGLLSTYAHGKEVSPQNKKEMKEKV